MSIDYLYNKKDKNGYTPIEIAVKNGHLPIIKYFIEKLKMPVNTIHDNMTLLHYASLYCHYPIVEYLVENGADVNQTEIYGNRAIHFASEGGSLAIVKFFIEKRGIDKDIKGSNGRTPLHCACEKGRISIVEYLISIGAAIEAQDLDDQTPLHYASRWLKFTVVSYLLSKGANKYAINKKGQTPHDLALLDEMKDLLK